MYIVHSSTQKMVHKVHITQCTVNSTQCRVHSAQSTVYSAQSTVYSAQYTEHIAQPTAHPPQEEHQEVPAARLWRHRGSPGEQAAAWQ